MSKRLGHQQTELYKINLDACRVIANKYMAHRREQAEKRYQGYRDEIKQIALRLQAQNISLTQKHILPYLAQPTILLEPAVRKLMKEICHELEAGDKKKP